MIVVTGATGRAGSEVVRALLEHGRAVRAFVRDPDEARRLFGDAVELAAGDFADLSSVQAAFHGAEQVFLSGADDPRRVGWETAAIDIAAATGVGRIVKLSSIQAEPGSAVAFWDWHGRIEQHLAQSAVPAVVLRSSFFMSNVLAAAEQVAEEGRLCAPAGEARIAMVDPRDVGAAAAAVLATAGLDDMTYVLTGPSAMTHEEVAAELSAVTNRAVEYVSITDDIARQGMIRAGLPDGVAGQVVQVYAALRSGVGEHVTDSVEMMTGRRPRDFATFARDHAHLFAPVRTGGRR